MHYLARAEHLESTFFFSSQTPDAAAGGHLCYLDSYRENLKILCETRRPGPLTFGT